MKERPILFSAPMVQALLEGRKTQTRRAVKLPKKHSWGTFYDGQIIFDDGSHLGGELSVDELRCHYGKPGDRLWVKETWAHHVQAIGAARDEDGPFVYAADGEFAKQYRLGDKWKPSIFMFRYASRILLEITNVRVERLQDISDEDCLAEGIYPTATGLYPGSPRAEYRKLWESINGAGSWDANPWVWAVGFKRIVP